MKLPGMGRRLQLPGYIGILPAPNQGIRRSLSFRCIRSHPPMQLHPVLQQSRPNLQFRQSLQALPHPGPVRTQFEDVQSAGTPARFSAS